MRSPGHEPIVITTISGANHSTPTTAMNCFRRSSATAFFTNWGSVYYCYNGNISYQVEVVLESMVVVVSDVPGAPLAVVVVGAGVDDDDVEVLNR